MSGSMLHSRSSPPIFVPKVPSFIGRSPRVPIEAIASVTESELYYNPHHRGLRKDYDQSLRCSLEGISPSTKHHSRSGHTPMYIAFVPDQAFPKLNFCALILGGEVSRASSLGLCDSASQQFKLDVPRQQDIK